MIPRTYAWMLVLALGGACGSAADPSNTEAVPANPVPVPAMPFTDFTADDIRYSRATDTTDAIGHARLRDGPALITADEIHYNHAENSIDARGHVIFTRGRGRLLADSVYYNRSTRRFHAIRIRLGRPPFFVSGESADGVDKAVIEVVVHKATVSYAEPGLWAPTIKADTIIYSPDRFLRLGAGRAGIGGFSMIPIPHITQNMARGAPVLSYMSFGVGYRSNLGGIGDVGLHIPVLHDATAGADLGVYTKRGVMLGPAADYVSAPGEEPLFGILRSGFIEDYGRQSTDVDILGRPVPRSRGFIDWLHQEQVTDDLTLDGQFNWWKDSEVVRDFRPKEFYPVQEPDSTLEAVYTWPDAFGSVFARFQPDSFEPVQERLPELRYDLLPVAIGGGFYERFNSSVADLAERPPGGGTELSDQRFDAFYGVSRPFAPASWMNFTGVAGARLTDYEDTKGAAQAGGYTRTLGEVGFDADLQSSAVFGYKNPLWDIDGIRHLLTPTLSYRYIPNADEGQNRIPQIDRQTFTTYFTPLDLGDVRYIDNLSPVNTLRLGLDNTLQTRAPDYGSRDLLTFNIANDLHFTRSLSTKDFSDTHIESSLTPAPWIEFAADNVFNSATLTLRELKAGVNIKDGNVWNLRLAGDFLRHEDDEYSVDGGVRLNEVFRADLDIQYDARQFRFDQISTSIEQNLSNIWHVRYYVSFGQGPSLTQGPVGRLGWGHPGFGIEAEPIKF